MEAASSSEMCVTTQETVRRQRTTWVKILIKFGRCPVQISVGTTSILTCLVVLRSHSGQMTTQYFKLSQERFLLYPFLRMVHYIQSFDISRRYWQRY
jgi:hypothetical protein